MNISSTSHPTEIAHGFRSTRHHFTSRPLRLRSLRTVLAACMMSTAAWAATVSYSGGLAQPFPGPGVPAPVNSFFDVFFYLEISALGPGLQSGAAQGGNFPFNGTVQALNQPDLDLDSIFTTEIISLNLSGAGLLIRESPTLSSTGSGIVSPGGSYVASFFDVFFELSIDGGANWVPSTGPMRVTRVPDAGSTAVLLLIALGVLGVVRRRLIS